MKYRSCLALLALLLAAAGSSAQAAEPAEPAVPVENRLPPLKGAVVHKPLEGAVPPFLKAAVPAGPAAPLGPQHVVVIAVKGDADSESVAKYYMDQRGIPASHLLLVDLPGNDGDAIPRGKFTDRVVKPLRELLTQNDWGHGVRCLVSAYRMPIYVIGEKVLLDPQETDLETVLHNTAEVEQHNNTTAAAVDSELSILFADQTDRDRCGWTDSPAYQAWDVDDFRTLGVFVTGRIDGPTPEIAKGLVDKALAAEKTGLTGKAYFDARKKAFDAVPLGYDLGERWMRLSSLHARNAGFDTTLDETDKLFAENTCPDCALYYGWYALTDFHDAFQSKPVTGALMIHLASGEGQIRWSKEKTPESPVNGGPWCLGFLRIGATGTCGPVQEPFLTAFPSDNYFEALFRGRTVGEAYALSIRHTSWMMHLIGDPLYRPFLHKPCNDYVYVRGQLRDGELGTRGIVYYTGNHNAVDLSVGRPWGAFKEPYKLRVIEKNAELDVDLKDAVCEPEADGHGLRIKDIKFVIADDTEFPTNKNSDFKFRFLEIDVGLTDASGAEKILPVTLLARPNPRGKKPAAVEPPPPPKAPPPKE
ncbi:MAG TPA: TIGR03790 family protein [Planctomycetota bacterium]|nr:TIGR03790 family protein [Planctomycetota bacterium]